MFGGNESQQANKTINDATMGIVVVNYRSHRLIAENLGSTDLSKLDVQVIVVDNFSTADERAAIARVVDRHGWQLVGLACNEGFGAGMNAGLRRAAESGCGSFLMLNPDVRIEPEVIDELRRHCSREPFALVTPRLVTPSGVVAFRGSQVYLDSGRIKRLPPPADDAAPETVNDRRLRDGRPAIPWLPATCLALHRELATKIGGFDEPYFLYWEDIDLSYRCQTAGGSLVIRHDLSVVHDEGGTQQRRDARALSTRYYYWNCRNRLLFAARHLPPGQVLRWVAHTPAESWQILMRGGRRQLLRSPAPLLATARGALTGVGIALHSLLRRRTANIAHPVT